MCEPESAQPSNALGSVGEILADAVSAIGLQIAVYYGLAGLAVVVAYRKTLLKSPANFLLGGLWPLCGALFTSGSSSSR